jgi:alpha-L-fucosidase 2
MTRIDGEMSGKFWRILLFPLVVLMVMGWATPGFSQGVAIVKKAQGAPEGDKSLGDVIVPGTINGIVYRRVGARALEMDGYQQPGTGRRPAVIVIHGGGWTSGSRVSYVGQFLELLTKAGYNWFSIDYRLDGSGEIDSAVSDLRAAIEFVRGHARELRVDPERIVLLGEDTGATMAAMVAMDPAARVSAQILIGGRYPLPKGPKEAAGGQTPKDAKPWGGPKTLLIHGTDDREVAPEMASQFCREMNVGGQNCDYRAVEGASHRPENWWPAQWGYKEWLIEWLNQQVRRRVDLKARQGDGPGEYQRTRLTKDIVYDKARGLKLDAWVPDRTSSGEAGKKGPFPAVILVHGGGWEAGDKVTYLTPVMRPLAEAGFAWFSIDYRLTPEVRHEEQLADLREAIRFVYREAKRYNIDRRRIAILGESASGQMVAQIAAERMPEVAAVVSFYGVYDFLPMATQLSTRSIPTRLFGITELGEAERRTLTRYSPIHQVGEGMAPLLLLCGTADGLFRQHEAMAAKLKAVKARYETIELAGAPHGMENWEGHPEWVGYKSRLVEWLKRVLTQSAGQPAGQPAGRIIDRR